MIMASPHFSIDELTFSETAIRHGIDNTPDEKQKDNLLLTANFMEDVREHLGNNIIYVSSGYRCLELNTLLGSKKTSSHVKGLACDFTARGFGSPNDIVMALINSNIPFDQIILEYDKWVHISFCEDNETPRRQALAINKTGTVLYSD